jgi:ribonuclease-3
MDTQEGYNREALIKDFLQNLGMGETDIHLVNMALTHSSYSFELGAGEDNERLEFLGDAVLGFIVSRYLFERYPHADEGSLSKMKARIVSGPLLARRAEELGLAPLLLLGKGEEQIGGRESPNLLSRALESLLGAFYLSAPFEHVSYFILKNIVEQAETFLMEDEFADYKSRLQEYAQRQFQCVPEYRVISETGPDHNKSFTVEVLIQGKPCGSGTGSRKKTAENEAARVALEYLQ